MFLGKRFLIALVMVSSLLALSACNKKTPAMASASSSGDRPDAALAASGPAATAYAMGNNPNGYQNQIRHNAQGEVINPMTAPANQTYYFTFDSNAVKSADYTALNVQAGYLASHPNAKVRLEGNADNRGSREYNIGLGWRRDQSVTRLLEQQGVRPNQIDMVSYGKERPIVLGDNERAWELNRRVHLVYEAY